MDIKKFLAMIELVKNNIDGVEYIEFWSDEINFCGNKKGFSRTIYATYYMDDEELEFEDDGTIISLYEFL